MSKSAQTLLKPTKNISRPNIYIQKLYGEFSDFAFDEATAPRFKGCWREKVFNSSPLSPLHLEIGTGTGHHFSWQAQQNPKDFFIGVELKYKPLIQTIRRTLKMKAFNARAVRYNGAMIQDLFADGEINNIYIHFPDPWPKKKHKKHRLLSKDFIKKTAKIQKTESSIEIKTDCEEYFRSISLIFDQEPAYLLADRQINPRQLKRAEYSPPATQFESIFIRKNQPIYSALWKRK